jgi:cohesin complex subunit SCC1
LTTVPRLSAKSNTFVHMHWRFDILTLTHLQAFKPGNVDLPANQSHTAAAGALTLPDTLTELDLLAPLPDPDLLLREPAGALGMDTTMLDFDTTQMLPESQTPAQKAPRTTLQFDDDDDLGLDLGMDPEPSIEIGRRAATPRNDEFTMLDDNAGIPGFEDTTVRESSVAKPFGEDNDETILPMDDDYPLGDVEDIRADNAAALARVDAAREQRSESPLSDAGSEVERGLEDAFRLDQTAMEEEDPTTIQAQQQRVKRRRVIGPDAETEIENSQIKRQQEDRSAITRAPQSLPRDPLLLQLMEMQRSGGFVSNIMGDGRMQGWAPELRGVLSIEVIRRAGEKRKRDSGVADLETASERQETPRLDLPEDDEGFQAGAGADFGADTTLHSDAHGALYSEGLQAPANDPTLNQEDDQEDFAASPGQAFDITEAPLLHPSQSGPVSLGTKTAVHLLRQHFAPDYPVSATEPPTPSQRTKTEAFFTDLCPEATTSKQDATKLFFEMLVLGTKDAIKVDQSSEELGGPIRVRGKRGLWGDWAEMGESQALAGPEVEGEAIAV